MIERWKDVVGYEGIYQVSNKGRVKRIAGGAGAVIGRILKLSNHRTGYLYVDLHRDGIRKSAKVHRLVANAFFGPPPSPDHEVNHRNGNKCDNRTVNLEWASRSENIKHSFEVLGEKPPCVQGERHGNSTLTRDEVEKLLRLYAAGTHTQQQLAEMFETTQSNIGHIVRGERWQHVDGPRTNAGVLRRAKGEDNSHSKLTRDQVRRIRQLYSTGRYTQKELASQFGISSSTISQIVRRVIWKHIP
jgi:DNA-binding MarR family transcriptional regulator